ncbi:uncharacterized protein LOC106166992 [Lingula anatina]|uniref:Uncharacterized protein LOC106166992 n=1 Tax=Lingula anatina TaxID=7574 RepID=A0A1S3IT46_LINAN|nr:uncharacterized protein LOC106166992 [Lingula anatina]|eukprot:XP_013401106.1 uncharacterized protein LOC106166992 [Lingula anatina]
MAHRGSKGNKKKASDRQYQNPTIPIAGEKMTHQSGQMDPDHRGSQSYGFNERSPGYVAGTRDCGHRHNSAHQQNQRSSQIDPGHCRSQGCGSHENSSAQVWGPAGVHHQNQRSGQMDPVHRGSQGCGFYENSPDNVGGRRDYEHRPTSAHHQFHYDEEVDMEHDGYAEHHTGNRLDFMQAQRQQFRSLQASKQMLYDVYEQNMGMIEELEARDSSEMSKKTEGIIPYLRSKIRLPTQKHKARTDVTAIIEAEIVCLQTQLMVAPKEVVASATEELIKKTLLWLAHRQDMAAPLAHCDGYAVNVLELLLHGNAEIQPREKGPNAGRLDEDIVNGVMGGFQGAKHKQKLQDEEFRRDEKKQPKLSDIRGGKSLLSGVRRVLAMKPNLEPYLSPFVNTEDLR